MCYDRHFPEGWRALGLGGAQIVFNPSATSRGLSYFVDPERKFVGGVGNGTTTEVAIRDLDLDLLVEVRNRWQFYRDRRSEAYGPLVQP